jgi:hypothetical protein
MTESEPTNHDDPPTQQTPPPAAQKEKKRRRTALYLAFAIPAVLLIVVLALLETVPYWVTALPWIVSEQDANGNPIAALRKRLQDDEATLADMTRRFDQLESISADLKSLSARVARLEAEAATTQELAARVAKIEARPAPKPAPAAQSPTDKAAFEALSNQVTKAIAENRDAVAKFEARIGDIAARDQTREARLVALANLRQAVAGAHPFAAELAAVEALSPDKAATEKALAPLEADARAGLPSLASLSERFDREVAPAILRARGVAADRDFGQQILARIERLVVIRRISPGAPLPRDAVEAAVVRAEDALNRGDLAGAVVSLGHLPPASVEAATPWLNDARRRIAAEAAVAKLWQMEVTRLAAPAPAGSKP